ncbi:general secretion pathway protein GspJ [Mesorhizobium sp. M1423]|uniref:hypothetical protein n=1 Tax=Mesorhizobium sp. M1423 TaxID=2957101 RepID=UPI00333BC3E1
MSRPSDICGRRLPGFLLDVLRLRIESRRLGATRKSSASVEGFALIDVLVGLALVGVISSLMIVFLGQARTMMRVEKATEMQMEVDAASRFLERAISRAEPLPLSKSSPESVIYLSGQPARIEFNGVQAIGFRSSALREIAVSLGSESEDTLAIVQKPRRGSENNNSSDSQSVRLFTGVTAIKFEYLDGSPGASLWSDTWSAQRRLPAAVRFTISVDRDGATYSSAGFARLELADTQAQPTN